LTFNHPSVSAIAAFIGAELGIDPVRGPLQPVEADNAATNVADVAAIDHDLDDLSESELAALLTGRLADL
jgi:hypothetical protein